MTIYETSGTALEKETNFGDSQPPHWHRRTWGTPTDAEIYFASKVQVFVGLHLRPTCIGLALSNLYVDMVLMEILSCISVWLGHGSE